MKKLITLLFATVLSFTFGTTAFAAEENPTSETTEITNAEVKQEDRTADKAQKKAEIEAFRAELKEQRVVIQANREANQALRAENKTLRQSIKDNLKAIKDSGTTLDKEISDQLTAYRTELKSIKETLELTKGDIKEIRAANKGIAKELDYAAMDAAFAEITSIQATRNVELIRINQILKEMLALLI